MMAGESEALTPSVEAPACSREKVDAVAGSKEVPLAGKMVQIKRKVGDNVETDETALALENMKMENTAMAPESCRLREIPLSEADNVTLEDVLSVIE